MIYAIVHADKEWGIGKGNDMMFSLPRDMKFFRETTVNHVVVMGGNTLNGILNQRSNDVLTANNWNVVQYAVLLIMFAQVSGLKAGELVHVIADAHIYDRHIPLVKEILENPRHKAPKLIVDESITNFYDFTVDSFKLVDYEYEKLEKKIPVAI